MSTSDECFHLSDEPADQIVEVTIDRDGTRDVQRHRVAGWVTTCPGSFGDSDLAEWTPVWWDELSGELVDAGPDPWSRFGRALGLLGAQATEEQITQVIDRLTRVAQYTLERDGALDDYGTDCRTCHPAMP